MPRYGSIPKVSLDDSQIDVEWADASSSGSETEDTTFLGGNSDRGLKGGSATITAEIATIAKNLVGSGVLSLSGGIALYSNEPSGLVSASVWIVVLGAMFGYFCLLIAKVCQKTHSVTYRDCWEATMGERGGFLVAFVNTMLPVSGGLSFATILSQTLQSLLQTCHIDWSRLSCLLFVTVFALLPLCMMKDLEALAPFSVLGIAALGVSMVAMIIRCLDGSYQPGGAYYESIDDFLQPSFGHETYSFSVQILPFVCMTFQSWVMHYNTPRFYSELKDASIPRFAKAVSGSFGISALTYIAIAGAGFLTFGGQSSSYILNNYAPNDPLATLSRVGVFFSTLLSYPLLFIGLRDGSLDLLKIPVNKQTDEMLDRVTLTLLTLLTITSVFVHDLGLINAVGGGIFATLMSFVFPALMYRRAVKHFPSSDAAAAISEVREVWFAMCLMIIGVVLGAVGVYQSIVTSME